MDFFIIITCNSDWPENIEVARIQSGDNGVIKEQFTQDRSSRLIKFTQHSRLSNPESSRN